MSTREDYPAGVPCWVDTDQPEPLAAARFYSALFGWTTDETMPPDSARHYLVARLGGRAAAAISSVNEGAPPVAVWNTYIRVDSADTATERVQAAEGSVAVEPFDVGDAGRMAVCIDPEGAEFSLWQAGTHRGAAAVNEHGGVVFNVLHTNDLSAAREFYGAVFGWDTIEAGAPMWALAGYGDHLEDLSPGFREAMHRIGAPARFEDVVAGIARRGDAAPHWSVTFAVDDADAVAAHARELGGSVIDAPANIPWQRVGVLADPAGASFGISQFVMPG